MVFPSCEDEDEKFGQRQAAGGNGMEEVFRMCAMSDGDANYKPLAFESDHNDLEEDEEVESDQKSVV